MWLEYLETHAVWAIIGTATTRRLSEYGPSTAVSPQPVIWARIPVGAAALWACNRMRAIPASAVLKLPAIKTMAILFLNRPSTKLWWTTKSAAWINWPPVFLLVDPARTVKKFAGRFRGVHDAAVRTRFTRMRLPPHRWLPYCLTDTVHGNWLMFANSPPIIRASGLNFSYNPPRAANNPVRSSFSFKGSAKMEFNLITNIYIHRSTV